jgi:hypothetical protein
MHAPPDNRCVMHLFHKPCGQTSVSNLSTDQSLLTKQPRNFAFRFSFLAFTCTQVLLRLAITCRRSVLILAASSTHRLWLQRGQGLFCLHMHHAVTIYAPHNAACTLEL